MFTAAALRTAETYLTRHLVANDYYSEHESVNGRWIGKGAAQLGIEHSNIGPKDSAFEAIRTNRMPGTLEPLTKRTASDRIAFYDFQVSAPKSVSVLAITFGDERLRRAHENAVEVAFRELEKFAARRVRVGHKWSSDENKFTGNLAAAAFTHDASRALDAQLHTHLVCANATYDASERQWYALQNREMFRAAEFVGRVYQNELACAVRCSGYEIRQVAVDGVVKSFEIKGVTPEDMLRQSTRRLQIEREIENFTRQRGRKPTISETHVIATSTRRSKLAETSTPEVRAAQLARYSAADRERLSSLVRDSKSRARVLKSNSDKTRSEINAAIDHLAERSAVFDRRSVMTTVLRNAPGQAPLETIRQETVRVAEERCVAFPPAEASSPIEAGLLSTRENLARELASIAMVDAAIGKNPPLSTHPILPRELSEDQKRAVAEILASTDGVVALRGPAGTGKTTTLQALDQAMRAIVDAAGVECVFVAPTHQAKRVLQRDGFSNARTVASLLSELKAGRENLTGKLLIVDEAGMQSTRDGYAVLSAAKEANARVLLVGDQKQLSAVEAGDLMNVLIGHSRLAVSQLSTIFRQRQNPEYMHAMKLMAEGKVHSALAHMDRNGWVHEAAGAYLSKAADAYCAALCRGDGLRANSPSTMLVAPTWREIGQLTTAVRQRLAAEGRLSGPEILRDTVDVLDLSRAERRRIKCYEAGMVISPAARSCLGLEQGTWCSIAAISNGKLVLDTGKQIDIARYGDRLLVGRRSQIPIRIGDRILLQGNSRGANITNGMRGIVTEVNARGDIRMIAGDDVDRDVTIPAFYKTLTHGYALTVHASQGATVDKIIGAVGETISGALWNVLTSRGRHEVDIYVPDKKKTTERTQNSIPNRDAAVDYMPSSAVPRRPWSLGRFGKAPTQFRAPRLFDQLLHAAATVASRFRNLLPQLPTVKPLQYFASGAAGFVAKGKPIEK